MRKLALILSLMLLAASISAQKIYILSVGIADYPGTENDLRLCAKDASLIHWLYGKNGNAQRKLLTNSQATTANIIKEMKELYAKAKENDIIVFFFSGHGMPGSFRAYDNGLKYREVRDVMAKSAARHKMIFADACYSGNMRGNDADGGSGNNENLDVMLFLSSRSNETSIESGQYSYGLFTTALEQGLRGKADDNEDRTITARELFLFVSKMVKQMSSDKQHPVMWGNFDNDMPVIKW